MPQLGVKSKNTIQPRRAEQRKKYSLNQIRGKDARGRYSAPAAAKIMATDTRYVLPIMSPSKDQKKTRAMVAKSSEEAYTCEGGEI